MSRGRIDPVGLVVVGTPTVGQIVGAAEGTPPVPAWIDAPAGSPVQTVSTGTGLTLTGSTLGFDGSVYLGTAGGTVTGATTFTANVTASGSISWAGGAYSGGDGDGGFNVINSNGQSLSFSSAGALTVPGNLILGGTTNLQGHTLNWDSTASTSSDGSGNVTATWDSFTLNTPHQGPVTIDSYGNLSLPSAVLFSFQVTSQNIQAPYNSPQFIFTDLFAHPVVIGDSSTSLFGFSVIDMALPAIFRSYITLPSLDTGTTAGTVDGQINTTTLHELGVYNLGAMEWPRTVMQGPTGIASIDSAIQIAGTQVIAIQQGAIADATDATDVITQLNLLLAACRTHGLIAS